MKKEKNHFKTILNIIIILFLFVYITGTSGYYENELREKKILTEEQIKKFEEDIINEQIIDINTYTLEEKKNYSNFFTKTGDNLDKMVLTIINDGYREISNIFSKLLT